MRFWHRLGLAGQARLPAQRLVGWLAVWRECIRVRTHVTIIRARVQPNKSNNGKSFRGATPWTHHACQASSRVHNHKMHAKGTRVCQNIIDMCMLIVLATVFWSRSHLSREVKFEIVMKKLSMFKRKRATPHDRSLCTNKRKPVMCYVELCEATETQRVESTWNVMINCTRCWTERNSTRNPGARTNMTRRRQEFACCMFAPTITPLLHPSGLIHGHWIVHAFVYYVLLSLYANKSNETFHIVSARQ